MEVSGEIGDEKSAVAHITNNKINTVIANFLGRLFLLHRWWGYGQCSGWPREVVSSIIGPQFLQRPPQIPVVPPYQALQQISR